MLPVELKGNLREQRGHDIVPIFRGMFADSLHTIPHGDVRCHAYSTRCACQPTVTEIELRLERDCAGLERIALMVSHHSFDGREFFEEEGGLFSYRTSLDIL